MKTMRLGTQRLLEVLSMGRGVFFWVRGGNFSWNYDGRMVWLSARMKD